MIARGEVWWADLGIPRGSEPGYRRPVVVVSSDRYNQSKLKTVTVVALTGSQRLARLPGNVAIATEDSGLPRACVANVTQLATIDRDALDERAGALPEWLCDQLDDGLRRALALG